MALILVNLPAVQSYLGAQVATALSRRLNTRVDIGRANLGLFNRVIIDDVCIRDQQGHDMLRAARISAKADVVALLGGRISITSAQLFGMRADFYKKSAHAEPNYRFALDALASKDTTNRRSPDVQLSSLIVRRGSLSYNQLDAPRRPTFDTKHIHVQNLSSHLVLNVLRDDSINVKVKRLSLKERSGLDVRSLRFKLVAGRQKAVLSDFELGLPSSRLRSADITATYRCRGGALVPATLQYTGSVRESYFSPKDLVCVMPELGKYSASVVVSAGFSGTKKSLTLSKLHAMVPRKGAPPILSAPSDIRLLLSGTAHYAHRKLCWKADAAHLAIDKKGLEMLAGSIPEAVGRLSSIQYQGKAEGAGSDFRINGVIHSDAGNANVVAGKQGDVFSGHIETNGLNLRRILDDAHFGNLATAIHVEGHVGRRQYRAKGTVRQIDYNDYNYHNVVVDGRYDRGMLSGRLSIDDPNLSAQVEGSLSTNKKDLSANLTAEVRRFVPAAVHLHHDKLGNAAFSGHLVAAFRGNSVNNATGSLRLSNFVKSGGDAPYRLDSLLLLAGNNRHGHFLTLHSDFAEGELTGRFDYATLLQSIQNVVVSKLPSIRQLAPVGFRKTQANNFTLRAIVRRSDWLHQLADIPLEIMEPIHIHGGLSSTTDDISVVVFAPNIRYNGTHYRDFSVAVNSPVDKLNADVSAMVMNDEAVGMEYRLEASASDDRISSILTMDNHAARHRLSGRVNATIEFAPGQAGQPEARMAIGKSTLSIGDSLFTIHPSNVVYSKNHLEVSNFSITGGNQYLKIDGATTKGGDDSLMIDLSHVNVSYVLNLVNFHAVEFSGRASGRGCLSGLFDSPRAGGVLRVDDFRFEQGRMGNLQANVKWNPEAEQIDIDALAVDTMHTDHGSPLRRSTNIRGYVSLKREYLELNIDAHNTRGEFVGTFCDGFMDHVDLSVDGKVSLWGPLGELNLTGELLAGGSLGITPLNTVYTLRKAAVQCLVNEIRLSNIAICDRNGNRGVVSGSLHHNHFSDLRYDIGVRADHLLAYDRGPAFGSTFYGTVYGTGNVSIRGGSGEVTIDADVTPEKNSQIVYDISSPDAIGSQEFIHWSLRDSLPSPSTGGRGPSAGSAEAAADSAAADVPTDIHLNLLVNTTPEASLKVLMDKTTGDHIMLRGSGALRAAYYNKGDLNIFGNYLIDAGVYKLTIQNIIKRDFNFARGGSIVFGGDPAEAALRLKAQYVLNSVSLSDLQIGRSFSGNNIRVNCIMNISGTPSRPKVEFDLDMPTIGTDAKQMIYSLINSEEELNQQVLYLLAVGRFYARGNNNANANEPDNRTTLAMQSILSGQISQQLNSVLGSVVKNNNWNLGANISPGDEGWNNAEYEGLLSGRIFNNRLLFDGQFGYRDNKNATSSFIGDFDLRYLITPNGNLSIHVYNKTNDRYFTRNALSTQGVGFILKKDFDSWRSLFKWKKKKPSASAH